MAKGTPDALLVDPDNLLDAKISAASPKTECLGVRAGMTGREAVETFLAISR